MSARLSNKRINFIQKRQLEQLPFIKRGKYKSGITFDEIHRRIKPYGELASRTIGSIYGESGEGNAGLEKRFEKELRGTDGLSKRQKVGDRFENVVITEPEDGVDILTTLDVNLLDIATAIGVAVSLWRLERARFALWLISTAHPMAITSKW